MLRIHQLNKTYPDGTVALRQLNLHAQQGMFGLLGPNGAGKSTLLRTIASLQTPDSGEIEFNGINVLTDPQALRKQLGYLPQAFGVYPHLSCRALLEHVAILKGLLDNKARRQQIDELLELTNLSAVAHKTVAHFSGGMRQRFGIAQALLGNPNLLILDEPTSGLDPEERQRLHNLLVEISQSRLVLLSSHIVEDIEQLCQQVAILLAGHIVVQGDTESLVAPMHGKVWQDSGHHTELEKGTLLLSQTYLRGITQRRVYADTAPHNHVNSFQLAQACLQDRYFFELQKGHAK